MKNPYYWYEGKPSDYPAYQNAVGPNERDLGGYVDNMSTGFAPRFYDEMVRKMFISSAAMLMEEFHIDGFRVDQTTSIHSYNVLHADGRQVPSANQFGAKFLREFSSTLLLINPDVMLTAEDHSGWDKVTQSPDVGGLGFHAAWFSDFYHHLIGDTDRGSDTAKLIKVAGFGGDGPLAMDYFADGCWVRPTRTRWSTTSLMIGATQASPNGQSSWRRTVRRSSVILGGSRKRGVGSPSAAPFSLPAFRMFPVRRGNRFSRTISSTTAS